MAAIEFICRRHVEKTHGHAGLSIVDGMWGYCAADAHDGHEWERVAPTDAKSIELARATERVQEQG